MRADDANPLWKPTFGDYFEYVFPYQGLPGVIYQPAGWMTPKAGDVNSVRNINYAAFGKAAKMLHRKGVWIMPHCPAMQWWGASSSEETSQEGAVMINMGLLSHEDPPDGFNFDAWLEAGADIAAIRRKADEVLPHGHYAMHAESHVADPPGFNTHYAYLFGRRMKSWEDDLYGLHYIWFAVRGLLSHGQGPLWGQRLVKLTMWDSLFWGNLSPWHDFTPAHYFDPEDSRRFVNLTKLLWRHGDLLGLVKDPFLLPKEELLQEGFAVNVFDGAAPAYFRLSDHPGADKRVYAFKTGGVPLPFGDAAYYEAMPPVPDEGPGGDLFATKYEPGFHYVSVGIDNSWRTPTTREGDMIIISARNRLARYGTLPADGETVWIIRYGNILNVGRSDATTLQVRVRKRYVENLLVEAEFRRSDFDEMHSIVSRPVINQEVVIDMRRDFNIDRLHAGDEIHVRLLREHVLDRWHIPYLLCDEVVLFGNELQIFGKIRNHPRDALERGSVVELEAEVGNDGDAVKAVQLQWELPEGWSIDDGRATEELTIPPHKVVRTSIRARVGEEVPSGAHKVCILVDSDESADGVGVNRGMDARLVVVRPPELPEGTAQFVSIETGGFKGMDGVTIPVEDGVLTPEPGMAYGVVEYDSSGRTVADSIPSEYVRVNEKRGLLSWIVTGNDEPYRNFYIVPTEGVTPGGRSKMMLSAERIPFPPGQADISIIEHKYCLLEVEMAVPYSKEEDIWVGFKDALPEEWSYRRFNPGHPVSMMVWRFRDEEEHPIVAMLDNGSGMMEISSGKKLEVEGHGTVDCNTVWGDFGWAPANSRMDRVNASGKANIYRMEWQRLYQRWYINGILVYERQIALDEPLPLAIENRTKQHMSVNWIRATSPYARK
jgi:hypothetical protein